MKQMTEKTILILMIILFSSTIGFYKIYAQEQGSKTRIITNMFNRKIEIPVKVKKIAWMPVSSYEMVLCLEEKTRSVKFVKTTGLPIRLPI